jgi:hypothetical protein
MQRGTLNVLIVELSYIAAQLEFKILKSGTELNIAEHEENDKVSLH